MLQRERELLPVARYQRQILYLVENHATCIIVGELGGGACTTPVVEGGGGAEQVLDLYLVENHKGGCTTPPRHVHHRG